MAASKKKRVARRTEEPGSKHVGQTESPEGRYVGRTEIPESFYGKNPSWNFNACDKEKWSFTQANVGDLFWREILPRLQSLEAQTWSEILLSAKKQNHSIKADDLNPAAKKRLTELRIEQDSLVSLRVTGEHRIYGFISGMVFHVLWVDFEHGDNNECVCRSYKKHT